MIGTRTSSQTRQILSCYQTLGITAPKAVSDASRRMETITAGVRQLGSSKGLADAVAHALATGQEPSTDPEVQRILTASAIGRVADEVDRVAQDELAHTLNAQADRIVSDWRKPFDQAAATLTEAHAILGPVPLEETGVIVRRGGDAAEAWGRAQRASTTIDTVMTGWVGLATIGHIDISRHYLILRIADVPADTWIEAGLTEQKLSPWGVVCAGYPLSLTTPTGYLQRIRTIEQRRVEREATRARQAHDRMTGKQQGMSMMPSGAASR